MIDLKDTTLVLDRDLAARHQETQRLKTALEFAAAGFAILAHNKELPEHITEFAMANFNQAKAVLRQCPICGGKE